MPKYRDPAILLNRFALSLMGVLILSPGFAAAGDMKEPWTPVHRHEKQFETRTEALAGGYALRFFQKIISPVDGPRCNLHPTCSAFARQAVSRFGLLVGWILTADRLMRDNSSVEGSYPRKRLGRRLVYFDPPEAHWPLGGKHTPKLFRPAPEKP